LCVCTINLGKVETMKQTNFITTQVEAIGPALAQSYLDRSAGNRSLKAEKVQAYQRDMTAGNWQVNGEPIIFDANMTLIDGHHRLQACINAGVTFASVVTRGVAPESNLTIDMGTSRTAADAISFLGYKNASNIQTIARVLMSLESGRARSANPSTQEVIDYIDRIPEMIEAAALTASKPFPKCGALIGAIYVVACRLGIPQDAIDFAEAMKTGVPHYPGCAAHKLREVLLQARVRGQTIMPREMQLMFVSAWEKFVKRVPVQVLRSAQTFTVRGWPDGK
jgi:hypothetical protein